MHLSFCPRFFCLSIVACALVPGAIRAERPSTAYLFPAGGQRGTKVDVKVGGHYLFEGCPFEMLGPGVKAPAEIKRTETVWFEGPVIRLPLSQRNEDYPKDYAAPIEIAADAPLGVRYARCYTSQGACQSLRFVVGDLPEVVEQEIDGQPIPTAVKLPVTINGRMFPREDVDVWTFEAVAGQSYVCSVEAARLGSPLAARLEVRTPGGKLAAEAVGKYSPDPLLKFTAKESGVHQVKIHDASFGGLQNYVYRLTITDGPWVESVYPLGGKRGSETKFEAVGQKLAAGPLAVTIPPDAAAEYFHRFSVPGAVSNIVLLAVDDLPERLEAEPNDTAEQAAMTETSSVVNGRIDKPGDGDEWAFIATKGQALELEVFAARLGSPLDSSLTVHDATGKEVAKGEDGIGGSPDALVRFSAPADGKYFVRVSERFASRGGPAFAYRLRIAPPRSDAQLSLASDAVSVDRGASQNVEVNLLWLGGLANPLTITVEGLPSGVAVAPVQAKPGQAKATLAFKAEKDARVDASRVKIVGKFESADRKMERVAAYRPLPGEAAVDSILLAVCEPTPFKFTGEYQLHFIPRGGTLSKRYELDRGGYDGPLEISLSDKQGRHLQGVSGPKIVVPPGAMEFEYTAYLPPFMELGRTSRTIVMAVGEVQGPDGKKHKVSYTTNNQNEQLVCILNAGLIQLVPERASLAAIPGEGVQLAVEIKRDRTLTAPLKLELVVPPHIKDVAADPVEVAPGQEKATLVLRFGKSPGPFNMPLLLRATAVQGNNPFVGEAPLEVVLD
jgi:hypothetical protein